MKKSLFMALLLASCLENGLAASTVVERAELVKGLKDNSKDTIKKVNETQQKDKSKYGDDNYIVVIEKNGSNYERVAHFNEEKLKENEKKITDEKLLNIIKVAEKILDDGYGPVSCPIDKNFAVVTKCGDFLVFNISNDKKEVETFVKANKPEEKKAEELKKEEKVKETAELTQTTETVDTAKKDNNNQSNTEAKDKN